MKHIEKSTTKKVAGIVGKISACLGALILSVVILLFGAMTVICYGPSQSIRDLFVNTVMETSAAKFLARIYFSNEKIDEIIHTNTIPDTDDVTDADLIIMPDENTEDFDINAIEIEDVKGDTFVGKLMTVNDPSRLFVATVDEFELKGEGEYLSDMIDKYGAVGGINGGRFYDPNGTSEGGMPVGPIIKNGVLESDFVDPTLSAKVYTVIGFDKSNKLIIGKMTGKQAIEKGVKEAVAFGPALIVNGERTAITGTGGGLNPRTAIGQRADGAVILLVVDGRQPHSLGATYKDLADVMERYGAVNAANLDGGSSSMLYYNGQLQNSYSMIGLRKIPSAFLISQPKQNTEE